jgi:hypothetical protein
MAQRAPIKASSMAIASGSRAPQTAASTAARRLAFSSSPIVGARGSRALAQQRPTTFLAASTASLCRWRASPPPPAPPSAGCPCLGPLVAICISSVQKPGLPSASRRNASAGARTASLGLRQASSAAHTAWPSMTGCALRSLHDGYSSEYPVRRRPRPRRQGG